MMMIFKLYLARDLLGWFGQNKNVFFRTFRWNLKRNITLQALLNSFESIEEYKYYLSKKII